MDSQYLRKYRPRLKISLSALIGKKNLVILLLVGIPVVSFILFSPRGVVKRLSLEAEKSSLEQEVAEAEATQAKLVRESRDLDHDQRVIEKRAREKYGMIRAGETVYRVKKEN